MEKLEERNELISVWVNKKTKLEFDLVSDNQKMRETIIRDYLKGERDWLEGEMRDIDDSTIKYSAKLITIKERFEKAHASYVEQIEQISGTAHNTFSKLSEITKQLESETAKSYSDVKQLSEKISSINYGALERLLAAVETYNNLSSDQREVIKLLLSK